MRCAEGVEMDEDAPDAARVVMHGCSVGDGVGGGVQEGFGAETVGEGGYAAEPVGVGLRGADLVMWC